VGECPDEAELERLGLYDPAASDAADQLRLLTRAFVLGATVDEVVRANRIFGLGPLLLDLAIRPAGETLELVAFAERSDLDSDLVHRSLRGFARGDTVDGGRSKGHPPSDW